MQIRVDIVAENDAFVEDFDGEIKKVLVQVEDYICHNKNDEKLRDSNGNTVGYVFRSTVLLPRRIRD